MIFIIIVGVAVSKNDTNKTTMAEETIINTQLKVENESDRGTIGICYLEIGDFSITQDYSGNPILLVEILFTNNNDEAKSFYTTTKDTAYQDGVEIKLSPQPVKVKKDTCLYDYKVCLLFLYVIKIYHCKE